MLHQPFPAELLPVQSAPRKLHHRGGANLGQLLEAPGGNKCSLPPSVPALARVCTDIIFSLYPLIWWGFPSTTLHPRNTPTHHFLDAFPNSFQAPSSRRADIFSGWNAKENSHGTTCLAAGISSEQNQGVLQIRCNCPEKGFSKATVVQVFLPRCTYWSLLLISSEYLPKALSPCLKIDMRLEVSDKRRHKTVAARDIKGQSWNTLQVQTDLAYSFLADSHQCTTLPPKYYRHKISAGCTIHEARSSAEWRLHCSHTSPATTLGRMCQGNPVDLQRHPCSLP